MHPNLKSPTLKLNLNSEIIKATSLQHKVNLK